MSDWRTVKAKHQLAALIRNGWTVKRVTGSHKVLTKSGRPDFIFAFHDGEEVGSRMLARVAKHTGLKPEDL